jgi:hypothetical protein
MTVPGIGPIISSAMVAAIGTGDVFSKGQFGGGPNAPPLTFLSPCLIAGLMPVAATNLSLV